jgi:predicted CoA-binding protein
MAQTYTLIIGASDNEERMSFQAVMSLQRHNYAVRALGIRTGRIGQIEIETTPKVYDDVDTISLYINPALQRKYYDLILATHPRRIIFNPGTENTELQTLAKEHGIETTEACTLVLLSLGTYR